MIKALTKNENNKVVVLEENFMQDDEFSFENKWIDLINPTDKEIEYVSAKTGIKEEMLKAALDDEERSRVENDDGDVLTLFDVPIIEEVDDYYTYSTIPMAIILRQKFFVTVCLKENSVLRDFSSGRVKNIDFTKRSRLLYQMLYINASKFLQNLKMIDKSSLRIQAELNKSMKNKELIQLMDLEKSLVYFSTSLTGNDAIIDKLIRTESVKKYDEDVDLLEDVAIENKQAIEMCSIYRDILSGTMDAFASIISNNLNILMKVLNAITIILAIPTLIASFWGMNVSGIPGGDGKLGFLVVVIVSALITLVSVLIMKKKKLL